MPWPVLIYLVLTFCLTVHFCLCFLLLSFSLFQVCNNNFLRFLTKHNFNLVKENIDSFTTLSNAAFLIIHLKVFILQQCYIPYIPNFYIITKAIKLNNDIKSTILTEKCKQISKISNCCPDYALIRLYYEFWFGIYNGM